MKLVNIGLEIRKAEKSFRFGSQELAELKLALPQMVKNVTEDEIILYSCSYGILFAVKQGNSIFSSTGERIGVKKEGQPANGEKWKLEMTDSDDDSVYIKNTFTNEYLFATEQDHQSFLGKSVSLALSPGGSEFKWIFEYQDTGFYIKNSRNSRYVVLGYIEDRYRFITTARYEEKWNTYECFLTNLLHFN